jgi:hypothetical protein
MSGLTRLGTWVLALSSVLSACGPEVRPLDIHDPRLPAEARRWIADAEDEVGIARTALREARAEAREFRAWRRRLATGTAWSGPQAVTAAQMMQQLTDARVALADREVDRAQAALDLALARRIEANATTAMRHDLAVYELAPIEDRTEAAVSALRGADRAVLAQRQTVGDAETAWWAAYRGYVASGGDTRVLWSRP